MVGDLMLCCFFVYWSQVRISYPCVVEELVDFVLVMYHPNWFFSKVFWVVYVIRISILVRRVIRVDLPDASIGLQALEVA